MYLSIYLSLCLSIYLSVYVSIYLSIYLTIYLHIYLSIYLSICLSVSLSICLSVYLSTCPTISLSICLSLQLSIDKTVSLSICLSVYLSVYVSIFFLSILVSNYLSINLCICLSVHLSICLSVHLSLSIYMSIHLSIYLSIYLSSCLSICLSVYLSNYLSTHLPIYPSTYLSIYLCLSVCLSVYLPDWKRSSSARLPHFSILTTSKTEQFWDTSSMFELNNVKNKAILRDFLQKWKVECSAGSLVPMRFAVFPLHLCKVLRLPRKIDARSYDVLHLSRKIISANLMIWCSKIQPLSGNQRPDLLTSLMNMSCVLRLPRDMHLWKSSSNVPRLPPFLEMLQNPHVLLTFAKVHNPLRLSKSAPCPSVFWTFDFEMCFAPQRRALFRHLNLQKWSDTEVFCTFWLRNVLRATTAIFHLSSGQLAPHPPL